MDFNHVEIALDSPLHRSYPGLFKLLDVLFGHCFGVWQLFAVGDVTRAIDLVRPAIDL